MNSIHGLSVLKNSFSWKFSKYPRFHKKAKLQIQEKCGSLRRGELRIPWTGDDDADSVEYDVVDVEGVTPEPVDLADHSPGALSPSPCWQFQADRLHQSEEQDDFDDNDYDTVEYSSITLESDGPLYENTIGYVGPPSPILLTYSDDGSDEHIYDDIEIDQTLLESRPANIFLSLVNDEGTTITPDSNIYEVPPGAIFNSDSHFEEFFPLRNISPPNGFQDKLTWERLHLIATENKEENNNEPIYSLPIKFSLKGSAIIKPRKKKHRPGIEELLSQIKNMKDSGTGDDVKDECREQDSPITNVKSETTSTPLQEVSCPSEPACPFPEADSSSNEVVVENIDQAVPSNLTVLQASEEPSPTTTPVEAEAETAKIPKDFTSIIEISGDGTWNTTKIPASHVESSKSESNVAEGSEQDFLTASSDARAKHVTLAYSGQYYTGNWPVASIKPMKHEEDAKKNIGAQIMEKYEEERKKIIEKQNLPDVSLLDVDESLEEIQAERRKIIEGQAVRAKRIDSWIKGRAMTLDKNGDMVKCEVMEGEECDSPQDSASDSINMYLDENGEVVYDSIIQNKNKIKSYWEQLMLAAELATQSSPAKVAVHQHHQHQQHHPHHSPPAHAQHVAAEKVHSPDLSEAEYFDALSHVSTVQSPDLVEKDMENLKLTETVVERDIRIQQERELALIIERQKALKSAKDKVNKPNGLTMKDKEEEMVRSTVPQLQSPSQPDEAYLSIPTTDEGNFSEYGSEDKEDHSPDGSRVTSPVGPAGIGSHHRTQSLDSMSSGHSSGSGSHEPERRHTFGPVKPLDEPDDIDILSYVKENSSSPLTEKTVIMVSPDVEETNVQQGYEKETPIEREIRLARDREEELRREKRISASPLAITTPQKIEPEKKKENSPRVVNQRVSSATQRVQQEIELFTEREKELKRWSSDDLQKDNTSKLVLKPAARKPKPPPILQNGDAKDSLEPPKTPNFTKAGGASPKIYIPNPQQKGLMKRFLASRGKMGSTPRLNTVGTGSSPAVSPAAKTPALSPSSLLPEPLFSFTSLVQNKEREEPLNLGTRPGYKSAEDKIQSELREMKRREEELRQQRRSNLYSARSQPDLLNIPIDSVSDREQDRDRNSGEDEPTRLPNTSKLRSALSVQNLLDVDDKPPPRLAARPKRKSALIEQWESRIFQNKN